MNTRHATLLIGLLLAAAPASVLAKDPAPAVAPPPPTMDDPGQPASDAAPIDKDDPRLKPLPAESSPTAPNAPASDAPVGPPKTDGDPSYAPRLPTDDAFHPPAKKPDTSISADGSSIHTYTTSNGDRIEEYRHGGQLTKVRVQPSGGFPYELRKSSESDHADRTDARDKKVDPVHFTLFEWH